MSELDLSVVVPVFDNEATLEELVRRLHATLEPLHRSYELVFVDDGSRDGSFELLERLARDDARIRPYALVRNFGSQAAICAGFDLVRGKRTVCLDADLENHPEDIPALLAALDRGFDLACGVREDRQDAWLTRRLPSALLNAWVRHQTGTSVRDVGCGMRAMDSRVVRDLASEGEQRRLVTPLLLRRARRVTEVPIRHRPKGVPGGHSFLTLLGIAMDYYLLTAKRPFLVTALAAVALAPLGIALLVAGAGGWRTAGGIALAVAAVLAPLSLAGEYAQRLYQLGQGLPFYRLRGSDAPPAEASARPPGKGSGDAGRRG